MIIQTLKLPAPESGATMLRALAIGYSQLGRKTLLVLPSHAAWVDYESKHNDDRDFEVLSAKMALMAWKRGGLSEFDAILVDEIAEAHTSEGNLWDILIHASGRSDTVLVGSDTQA
ncbi:TPA: hypothetical protein NG563_004593 [Vibrio parahaemolyticus]|uniref:hypothetical protein n=1 Tax=Vibrio harveyi group TaxID=717610 RepID=UPI00215BF5E4|nr:hypothetical protein [Vibrio parahaemolyticus]ELH9641298.1 hypothetical protein [Vibrio alginolyticus]MCR9713902.1 hypothetical protein [Vibrio parahaemolyticus]HCE3247744.1 hypothetical protein [Vibrio parahaemolyticus]HCE3309698.1 hypothetical protein [Vibrio parahaemolyticus]